MSWAFEHLGLRPDAGERDVKRAYARLLKETRPAEDPEGFQRLREAYEAALAQTARREQVQAEQAQQTEQDAANNGPNAAPADRVLEPALAAAADPAPEPYGSQPWTPPAVSSAVVEALPVPLPIPLPSAEPEPVPEGERVTMTPVQIAHMLLEQVARLPNPDAVRQWLADQSFLWQLDLKHAVADVLPWVLNECEEPLFADSLDALWAFFDLDQVTDGSHLDRTYAYQHKRHELSLRWLMVAENRTWVLQPSHLHRLQASWVPGFMGVSFESRKLGRRLAWAGRPVSLWHNVLRALRWGEMDRMTRLLAWLSNDWQYALAPPLDGDQLRFWLRANDGTQFSQARLAVVFSQFLLVQLALLLPFVVVPVLLGGDAAKEFARWVALAFMGVLVPVHRGLWAPFVAWQARPESQVSRFAWVHTLSVPLLAVLGLIGYATTSTLVLPALAWTLGSVLMFHRARERHALKWGVGLTWLYRSLLSVIFYLAMLGVASHATAGYGVSAALVVLWIWELFKARPLALWRTASKP